MATLYDTFWQLKDTLDTSQELTLSNEYTDGCYNTFKYTIDSERIKLSVTDFKDIVVNTNGYVVWLDNSLPNFIWANNNQALESAISNYFTGRVVDTSKLATLYGYIFCDVKTDKITLYNTSKNIMRFYNETWDDIEGIEDWLNNNCTQIQTETQAYTIDNDVTDIGAKFFSDTEKYSEIQIPISVTNIEDDVFDELDAYTDVYYDGKINDWCKVTLSGEYSSPKASVNDFYIVDTDNTYKDVDTITSFVLDNSLTEIKAYTFCNFGSNFTITIPNTIISIGKGAFYSCTNLENIEIPESVTNIGDFAFENCSKLTSLTIPNNVTSIGNSVFYGCSGLTNLIIGNGMTNILNSSFHNCGNLTNIKVLALTPPQITSDSFDNNLIATIYVRGGSVNKYKTATNWSNYATLIEPITGINNIGNKEIIKKEINGKVILKEILNQDSIYQKEIKLATPIITLNNNNLSWVAIPKSLSYTLYADNTINTSEIQTTNIDLSTITLSAGQHSLRLKAIGNNTRYLDSNLSVARTYSKYIKLSTPILTLNDNILTWEEIQNTTSYTLYVNDEIKQNDIQNTQIDLSSILTQTGTYNIQLKAIGTNYYTDSDLSSSISYVI